MMGLKGRTFAPLVAVSLEELVPQDHFYRHLQKVLDLSFIYDLVRECYSVAGRPSIDPVVFFKLQLVMFFEDIRSERLLMQQVADETIPEQGNFNYLETQQFAPVLEWSLSDWCETHQRGNGGGGIPTSAIAFSGKVVCQYQVFSTGYAG